MDGATIAAIIGAILFCLLGSASFCVIYVEQSIKELKKALKKLQDKITTQASDCAEEIKNLSINEKFDIDDLF